MVELRLYFSFFEFRFSELIFDDLCKIEGVIGTVNWNGWNFLLLVEECGWFFIK